MSTRDGVRLDADVYYPPGEGPWPTLLMRQPYGRRLASTLVYAHPQWYAAQGYLVVIQDVRGRGSSGGEFDLFAWEREDGEDCLQWLAQLPECNGAVAMYGFSYQAVTQLFAASNHHPCLKTICPAMVAWDLYQDWAYENSAFCLANNLGWALQLAADSAKLKGDGPTFQQLARTARHYDYGDPWPAIPDRLGTLAPDSFYHQWLAAPPGDEYWQRRSPEQWWRIRPKIDIPVLQIGGWFDPHLRGNLRLYESLKQADINQKLVVGPWGHFPWGRRVGGQDYGAEAARSIDQLQLAWFDHFLKQQSPRFHQAPLELFDLGNKQWQYLPAFPPTHQHWFLHCSGLGASQGSQLSRQPDQTGDGELGDVWVHDPWRPVPSGGGHASSPPGVWERGALDDRHDVVTYTSPPLEQRLTLAGIPKLVLSMESDCPSFDVAAALSQVNGQGQVLPFSHGYGTSPRAASVLEIPLQATCITLPPGDRLRLSLSGASFPAYPVNPGTGAKPVFSTLGEQQIITLRLTNGGDRPNCLTLPSLPGEP